MPDQGRVRSHKDLTGHYRADCPGPPACTAVGHKDPEPICPFCGGSRFLHSGIQIPDTEQECWDKRGAVLMLRPEEMAAGRVIHRGSGLTAPARTRSEETS